MGDSIYKTPVVPAQAGTQRRLSKVTGSPPARGRRNENFRHPAFL